MMKKNNLRLVVIPAYEPEPLLLDLLDSIHRAGLTVIVVDDGSGPAFADIFRQASATAVILTHTANCGKGRALKTGMQYIGQQFDGSYTVVTMDADGQHCIADALRVCEAAEHRPDTLILGSRQLAENVPLRSRLGNSITRWVYRISTGLHVHDTQTGLRAFGGALLPSLLEIPGERYEYEMNVLLEFARHHKNIEEIGISTIYLDNNTGSHFNTLKDSYRIYREILKYSASSLISFLTDYLVFSLLIFLTSGYGSGSLILANTGARLISASVNYTINRRLVFKNEKSVWETAVQYSVLAVMILAGNTIVLGVLTSHPGMNQYRAKLLTELLFFMLSWTIQHFLIFNQSQNSCRKG